jgi:branched-chain amino acid transport system substrate-binding protein
MLRNKNWMIILATVLGMGSAQAQIKVGITMSGSGPGAALGQPQSKTVAALPKEIAGQKITYFALDDESDPTKGAQNARKLIGQPAADRHRGGSQDAPDDDGRRRRSGHADG